MLRATRARVVIRSLTALLPALAILAASAATLLAQSARIGITVPVTLSGQLVRTERAKEIDPDASSWNAGFRANFYPAVRLGESWYFYSALQLHSEPYFYYETYYPGRALKARLLQGFLGYSWTGERRALNAKVGQLTSAFGSYPLRYDETANALLDQPLGYSTYLKIRPDALPCGTKDLPNLRIYTEYVGVHFYCGGPETLTNGQIPVSLYGLPGAEMDVSWHSWDGRFQLTNSSPSNPQGLNSDSQHAQWTAGGGYTLWQGFHVGISAFQGPFLERNLAELLPAGKTVRDYPARAIGADAQWARGRLSANFEWFRAAFPYPRLLTPVTVQSTYGELKAILHPRWYAAARASWQVHNHVRDSKGRSPLPFQPNLQAYEVAVGFRPNRWQLLKVGYEWLHETDESGTQYNVLGLQLVTSLDALSKAIR